MYEHVCVETSHRKENRELWTRHIETASRASYEHSLSSHSSE